MAMAMAMLWNSIRSLTLWQMATLVLVLFGTAAATYWLYSYSGRTDTAELAENQQLIPIEYGDIVNQVSTNGNLAFPERETVSFDVAGTLGALLVEKGQQVSLGQELARLDDLTIESLEAAVAQAQVDLLQAREDLADFLEPYSPVQLALDRAKIEETIAAARLQRSQAAETREEVLNPELPTEQDVKAQEEAIAAARLSLQQAIKSREELLSQNLLPDYNLKIAESHQGEVDAENDLAGIQEALKELEPSARELVEANQALLQAQIDLDQANQALTDFKNTQGSRLARLQRDKQEVQARLDQAKNNLAALQEEYDSGTIGLYSNIRRWESYINSLEGQLEELRIGIVSEAEQLETAILVAEVSLVDARELVAELGAGPDALERQRLEAQALAIIAGRAVAERDTLELEFPNVDPVELALKDAQVSLAEATLAQAAADLAEIREELLVEPNPLEIALLEKQIILAEATLAQAQEDLAEAVPEDPDPLEIALKEVEIDSARIKLQDTIAQLEATVIYAPLGGFVSRVDVEAGDPVKAETEILEIVDSSVIEIDGIVDEIDVLSVREGTPAQVTLDALPDRTLEGIVTEIATESLNQQGVVSYPISIRVQAPEGVEPREGLSAIANIVLRSEQNVLLVPQQALYGSFDQPVVRVMTNLGVSEQPVALGSSDDFWVAVLEGLTEGDQVVLETADVNTGQFSFRQFRQTTGGGRGGGGRR